MRIIWRKVGTIIKKIAYLDSTPPKIAGSVALGTFIGSIPMTGLQNATALLLSIIFRVNKVGTILSLELYSNPLTLPFICYANFKIGQFLLGQSSSPLHWKHFRTLDWTMIFEIAKPLFLGSIALGSVIALVMYPVSLCLILHCRKRKANVP